MTMIGYMNMGLGAKAVVDARKSLLSSRKRVLVAAAKIAVYRPVASGCLTPSGTEQDSTMEHSIASTRVNVPPRQPDTAASTSSFLASFRSALGRGARKLGPSIAQWRASLAAELAPPLRIDAIARELAIEERGRADGSRELPPKTDQVVTGTQREIVAHFNELQRRAQRRAAALIERMRQHRERIDLADTAGSLRELVARSEDRLLRLDVESRAGLGLLEERERQQRAHYHAFREANGLARVAEYPSSPLVHAGLAVALAGALGLALAKVRGDDGSTLIPLSWAASIALAGVLVPSALGATLFRCINHVSSPRRSAGRLGGVLAGLFIAALATLVGGYVAALGAYPGLPLRALMERMVAEPIASAAVLGASTQAWKASGIIALIGVLAWCIGYRSDDPYPGYGSVQRAFYRARRQRERLVKRLYKRIHAIVDEAAAEAARLPKRLKAKVSQYVRLAEESKRIPARMADYNAALEDACNVLLDRYRAVNSGVRSTAAPLSFDEQVCYGREPSSTLLDDEDAHVQKLESGVAELEREAAEARRKLTELRRSALASLRGG